MRRYVRYACLFFLAATAAQAQLVREAPPPVALPPEPVVGV